MTVNFYTTVGCHLCEEALVLLQVLQEQAQDQGTWLQINEVDIALEEVLMAEYGLRIPVIASSGQEIGWPFSLEELSQFLNL
ncbi:MAG: glutaredoxin family protein [Gammaproteobacteria bacterium]|nr:glutaredoxin family protein [Gammaproteobacteria bacterium]